MARNKEQTMNRLLEAAAETIVTQGVDSVSVTDTATRAGVNKHLVYRYFRGWNGLLETLFAQLLAEIIPVSGTGLITGRIDALVAQEAYILAFSRLVRENSPFRTLLRWQIDHSETVLGMRLTELLNESIYQVAGSDMANVDMLRLLVAGVIGLNNANESTERTIRHLFIQLRSGSQSFNMAGVSAIGYSETVFMH